MKWIRFWDMNSGGRQKLNWEYIFIEAPSREQAEAIFETKFNRDPHNITCKCCGPDYDIQEYDTLEAATEYKRERLELTLEQYFAYDGNSTLRVPYENS